MEQEASLAHPGHTQGLNQVIRLTIAHALDRLQDQNFSKYPIDKHVVNDYGVNEPEINLSLPAESTLHLEGIRCGTV